MAVSSFEPLEIWKYDEFYVRLCAADYAKEASHKDDLYMSLANNSISKYSEEKKKYHENMMFMHEFEDYLKVTAS